MGQIQDRAGTGGHIRSLQRHTIIINGTIDDQITVNGKVVCGIGHRADGGLLAACDFHGAAFGNTATSANSPVAVSILDASVKSILDAAAPVATGNEHIYPTIGGTSIHSMGVDGIGDRTTGHGKGNRMLYITVATTGDISHRTAMDGNGGGTDITVSVTAAAIDAANITAIHHDGGRNAIVHCTAGTGPNDRTGQIVTGSAGYI